VVQQLGKYISMATRTKEPPRIAILAWGSLIWDTGWPKFDEQREESWLEDGPTLPLEFSRVSQSRDGALTLVIDPENGRPCIVKYAFSRRQDPEDAIADLRDREGTTMKRMGFYFAHDPKRKCVPKVPESVITWATEKNIDVIV
jgi:hypothetical protein